ncbi:MAG: efflux RND transporter periplasmic adaptor subunit [Pseudomonadota bacterium]
MTRLAITLATTGLLIFAGFYLAGDRETGTQTLRVETSLVDRGDILRTVAASGAVRPLVTVEVGSQLSGQIKEIFVDFNTEVQEGQLLALIDAQSFESRVLQSRADLDVANANIALQRASVDRADANLRRARRDLERAQPLAAQGTLSSSELDSAVANHDAAQADLTMANAQLENAQAAKKQREASLESAEIDLERTRIRSPINGIVIERAVDQGQTVAASLSSPVLFYIAQDLTQIQIEANIDEADIGNVSNGNDVSFSVDAFPDLEFGGRVDQVRLAPNETNNVVTYTVIINAANPGRRLLPGMTAMVEIITGKSSNVLRITNDAVRFGPAPGSALAKMATDGAGSGGQDAGAWRRTGRNPVDSILEQLALSPQQETRIRDSLQQMREGRGGAIRGIQGQPSPMSEDSSDPRRQMRQQMQQRVASVLKANLDEAQYQQYEALRRQAADSRTAQIWVQSNDGHIGPMPVRLGISDETHTQVTGPEVQEGLVVVTRIFDSPQ